MYLPYPQCPTGTVRPIGATFQSTRPSRYGSTLPSRFSLTRSILMIPVQRAHFRPHSPLGPAIGNNNTIRSLSARSSPAGYLCRRHLLLIPKRSPYANTIVLEMLYLLLPFSLRPRGSYSLGITSPWLKTKGVVFNPRVPPDLADLANRSLECRGNYILPSLSRDKIKGVSQSHVGDESIEMVQ